jgi:hypothetical protein
MIVPWGKWVKFWQMEILLVVRHSLFDISYSREDKLFFDKRWTINDQQFSLSFLSKTMRKADNCADVPV